VLAVAALTVLATACGDSLVDPAQQRAIVSAAPAFGKSGGPQTFTYYPDRLLNISLGNGNAIGVGNKGHSLQIPANAICDPAVSSYGTGEWDKPCVLLTTPIQITAKVNEVNGFASVEFEPALRFSPDVEVILTFSDKKASSDPLARILYCSGGKTTCVDESKTDPSLVTHRDFRGQIFRRIKHFSGYNVVLGGECDLSLGDPDCIDIGGGEGWRW
jgi:hypothetical protein